MFFIFFGKHWGFKGERKYKPAAKILISQYTIYTIMFNKIKALLVIIIIEVEPEKKKIKIFKLKKNLKKCHF